MEKEKKQGQMVEDKLELQELSLKERMKEIKRREKGKLKQMTLSEKVGYIWNYYKSYFAIGAFIAVAAALVIFVIYRAALDKRLNVLVVNDENDYAYEYLQEKLEEYYQLGKLEMITVDGGVQIQASADNVQNDLEEGSTAIELDQLSSTTFFLKVKTGTSDIMVADRDFIEYCTLMDTVVNLEDILPDELLEKIREDLYYYPDSEGNEIACAVLIPETVKAKLQLSYGDGYVSIPECRENEKEAVDFIRWMYGMEKEE